MNNDQLSVMKPLDFDQKLQRYAELIVKVGLNLQPGQRLIAIARLEAAPLVRQIAAHAYRNGCRLVNVIWRDEQLDRVRFQFAPRDSFEEYPTWLIDGLQQCIERGDAYLQIAGFNPDLLKDQDPELIAIDRRTAARYYQPIGKYQSDNSVVWSIACAPTAAWAMKVYPDEAPGAAESRLWDAIFDVCRLYEADPIEAWEQHVTSLDKRREYLNSKRYTSLHFTAPGTDLVVGLPEGHLWFTGREMSKAGIPFVVNLPTEEVFTIAHRDKTQGVVTATKPLSYAGYLIENFTLTFAEGRVVKLTAEKGEATLNNMIEMDENAGRLGEVALVPHRSPISQSGLIFFNSLLDENAADHIALGDAYRFNLRGGESMSEEEFAQAGGNHSLIHVDFMIGSDQMNVDGVSDDGTLEPVMRAGEWTFEV